jgi:hypothetical protein
MPSCLGLEENALLFVCLSHKGYIAPVQLPVGVV